MPLRAPHPYILIQFFSPAGLQLRVVRVMRTPSPFQDFPCFMHAPVRSQTKKKKSPRTFWLKQLHSWHW
ncbi:MAG TPA: hypothetical protein VF442_03520, partial [Sphingobium sp.]